MIDFVKILYKDKSQIEPYMLDSNNFEEVTQILERHSGEIRYPYTTKFELMEIRMTQKYGTVKNSLHQLYNYINFNEKANYNDFSYSKLVETIDVLNQNIPDSCTTRISQLEFGLNISTNIPAEDIIRRKVLMHDYKGYNHNKQYHGKGELKRFDHANYLVKIYDKEKQYKSDYNVSGHILRFEVRFTRNRDFNNIGVYNLNDLKSKQNLRRLFQILLKRFDDMQIVDVFDEATILDQVDYQKLTRFCNPQFWEEVSITKSRQTRMRYRMQFEDLVKKYNLDSTKVELKNQLRNKFVELMNN